MDYLKNVNSLDKKEKITGSRLRLYREHTEFPINRPHFKEKKLANTVSTICAIISDSRRCKAMRPNGYTPYISNVLSNRENSAMNQGKRIKPKMTKRVVLAPQKPGTTRPIPN